MKIHKISDNELSAKTGLPSTTIYRLKVGYTTDPRLSTLKRLADFFNVTLAQIANEEPLGPDFFRQGEGTFFRIPVLEWKQAFEWKKVLIFLSNSNHSFWTYTDRVSLGMSFALKIESSEYGAVFPKESLICIDGSITNITYPHYAVVSDKLSQKSSIVKVTRGISNNYFVHPANDAIVTIFDAEKYQIMGVIVSIKTNFTEKEVLPSLLEQSHCI